MTTDTEWSWTVLMRNGQTWHCFYAVNIHRLLELYQEAGFHLAEIEAIVRH